MSRNRRSSNAGSRKLSERVLLASVGAWLVGRPTEVRLRGTPEQLKTVSEALLASKMLHEELMRPGASLESVMRRIQKKNAAAQEFHEVFGVRWPL